MSEETTIDYAFESADAAHTHSYLWGPVEKVLAERSPGRLFELGCGNGAFAHRLAKLGYEVTAVDPSPEGISLAKNRQSQAAPTPSFAEGNAYEPLWEHYGTFPCVVSLEVIEHVYYPRKFAHCVANLLDSGGTAILSTPYHGYLKNLLLAVSGKMDSHFTALWDHGHIKFWSPKTLVCLLAEQNLAIEQVIRVGRVPALAKSMICVFRKR